MTGTLGHLLSAMLIFIASHIFMSCAWVREPLIAKIGRGPFKGVYAIIAAATMYWVVAAYSDAPPSLYWDLHTAFKHLSLSFMLAVCIFIVAPLMTSSASQPPDKPFGIFRLTRHPMMWGIALWALLHVLANGNNAALIFFGGFFILALLGTHLVDRRKARENTPEWREFSAQTSHIPFAAILAKRTKFSAKEIVKEIGWRPVILGFVLYLTLLILHETLFGVAPMSWVAGLFD